MRYATAGAFRAALERRLSSIADETSVPLVRLRKLIVFDRLMARLTVAAPNRWVVKGAVALLFRIGPEFRTTKDMDLARQDNEEAATEDLIAAQSIDVGDHFAFAIERTKKLDSLSDATAVRYHVTAELAGRTFEEVTLDVGFGDPFIADPELVRGPDLLNFADIPPAEVPALPVEQHVAEKVHAYTRMYGGQPSTRVKDLVDLVMISSLFTFEAGRLRRALTDTFAARATHDLPGGLPAPPAEWRIAYRKIAAEMHLDPDVSAGYEQTKDFLDPVLAGAIPERARWDPTLRTW
jgi:hypothetical protein